MMLMLVGKKKHTLRTAILALRSLESSVDHMYPQNLALQLA